MDVRQARKMVQDRSEWWGFVRGSAWGHNPGDEPLTLTRCHSYTKPVKGGSPFVPSLQLKGHKGKICFSSFLGFFYCSFFLGMMYVDPVEMGAGDSMIIYIP